MSVSFSVSVKADANGDKICISAKGLVDAAAASWKAEVHDKLWPANKTWSHENKKLDNEKNWNTMTMSIRPKAAGRILVWRAQTNGDWTPWALLDVDAERKKSGTSESATWEQIFADLMPEKEAPSAAAA